MLLKYPKVFFALLLFKFNTSEEYIESFFKEHEEATGLMFYKTNSETEPHMFAFTLFIGNTKLSEKTKLFIGFFNLKNVAEIL
jgi:hypothetical protein